METAILVSVYKCKLSVALEGNRVEQPIWEVPAAVELNFRDN